MSARFALRQQSSRAQRSGLSRARVAPELVREDIQALEFSDYGRDPQFLPGWWILPSILGSLTMMAWLFAKL